MENTSDSLMPRPLLLCLKSEKIVCYSVPDNNVTIREVREKTVAVKASSKEEAEKGCRMYGPSTSEYDIQSVQYEAVEREAEKTFEIEIRKSYTIRKSISARSKEDAVERAEILYDDGGFDDEFDESTMDVSFEVKAEKVKKKEQVR